MKKLAPKKGDKVLHFETLWGEDAKAALTELGAKGKMSLPAPKPAASSDEKTLAKITELRQTFLALHKSKGAPKFREGGRNEPRYNAVIKLETAELVKVKEFTGAS